MKETAFADSLVQDYLQGKEIGVLSTINPDGSPLATPMWFVHDPDGFGMVSVAADQKVKNLQRDLRASVVIESGSGGSLECVIIQGTAEFLATSEARDSLGAKFIDKYGPDMEARWGGRSVPATRSLFRIHPTRVKLWGTLAS